MDFSSSRPGCIPRIRVISLGNCGVGKSCLIKRYCEQRFVQRYLPTIGIDYGSTTVEVEDRRVSVHFFDTSGSPIFEEVRSEFYADMQGVLLVYDVTDRASFIALDHWMAEVRHNLGQASATSGRSGVASLVVVAAGNRSDTGGRPAGRQVSEQEGRTWAARHGALHAVTSAAIGTGVTQAFSMLFSAALHNKEGFRSSPGPSSYRTNGTNSTKHNNNNSSYAGASAKTNGANSTENKRKNGTAAPSSAKPNQGTRDGGAAGETEAEAAIDRLLNSSDNFHKMQLSPRGLTKEDVNKSYRRLAGLVHPDKCQAPGAEEAFKRLAQARTAVLGFLTETTV
ncbi:DnaJ domain [Trinorchestia longiramus]|nr:DnaJ domain [Trinorchestia longiramus]